jgi:hypothetical protein
VSLHRRLLLPLGLASSLSAFCAPPVALPLCSLIESSLDDRWEAGHIESESSVVVRGFNFLAWLMQVWAGACMNNIAVAAHAAIDRNYGCMMRVPVPVRALSCALESCRQAGLTATSC